MAYEKFVDETLEYDLCSYSGSKLFFRGPKRDLRNDYIAFLGGTETFGKFLAHPFPELVEQALGVPCVNLGWSNAGVDVFLNDPGLLDVAQRSRAVVLQMPCAHNMSNRYYSVHPRRNDRFLGPSQLMRRMFPEVDFTEFHFTRHLMSHLQHVAPDRFATLRRELQTIWVSRMRVLIKKIDQQVMLLWFSRRRPGEECDAPDLALAPAFVTRRMIESIQNPRAKCLEVRASPRAQQAGLTGMVFAPIEENAASELLGPEAHEEAAEALVRALKPLVGKQKGPSN